MSIKPSGIKYQIEQKLLNNNWEIVSIGSNEDWWDDEHWKINYKYDPKISFYLCFVVDPMFESVRKKGKGIYEIKAVTKFPSKWNDDVNKIAAISLTKRKFDIKLSEFIMAIEEFKTSLLH